MRVVAGIVGGRRLRTPSGATTRPTSDRVREAVFNALESLGAVSGARVLDLFAGSGAMGIEALSRGATHACFVDDDRGAVSVIEDNLAALDLAGRATVVRARLPGALSRIRGPVDLVVADPPYAFDDWVGLLDSLEPLLERDAVVVIESDRSPDLGAHWEKVREKSYAATVVVFARSAARTDPTGDPV